MSLEKMQGQMLLLVVGMAFLIAILVFGSGVGVIVYKLDRLETNVKAEMKYAQDMAEIRQSEIQELCKAPK